MADRTTDRNIRFAFRVGQQAWNGSVLGPTKSGMTMRLCGEAASFDRGMAISDGRLVIDDMHAESLEHMFVDDAALTAPGELVVSVGSSDPATRGRIWAALAIGTGSTPRITTTREDVPKVPARGVANEASRIERLEFAAQLSGVPLTEMRDTTLEAHRLSKNIEGLIGSVEIPVGVAGPLLFRGERVQGVVLAPFATTEGALVASATRGARALSLAGGVSTHVSYQRMVRSPVFMFADLATAARFARWIDEHSEQLASEAKKVSRFAKLEKAECYVIGRIVHVVFEYSTANAAGQNMTTATTWHACKWILAEIERDPRLALEHFQVEGNLNGDKKFTYRSFLRGRGVRVSADVYIPGRIIEDVLKVTPKMLVLTNDIGITGTLQGGGVGHSINVSNAMAAIFAATGQDIACVHECGAGIFTVQAVDDGIYASMVLPNVVVGTVGGGTHLPRQHALLQMMGCDGEQDGAAARLAEIIAGFCLGLDLSTLAAVASNQFVSAHERLGRNRPVEWLQRNDINATFLTPAARRMLGDPRTAVVSATPLKADDNATSIITELTSRKVSKYIGLLPMELRCELDGKLHETRVMVKVKPLAEEVTLATKAVSSLCGDALAGAYSQFSDQAGFDLCHVKELAICGQTDPRFTRHMPAIYDVHHDPKREAFVIVMELLQDAVLLNTADDVSGWQAPHLEAAIEGAAAFHSVWLGRERELAELPWIGFRHSTASMVEMTALWTALAEHGAREFPDWFGPNDLATRKQIIGSIAQWWPVLEGMPRTLIHNDFNPRNVCLRSEGDDLRLCAYDWELATCHVPQRDLAELLAFTLQPARRRGEGLQADEVERLVEHHRLALERHAAVAIDRAAWRTGFRYALWDFAIMRMGLYVMAHTVRSYAFMRRVFATLRRLLEITDRW